ncbi:MAG: class I SAM-dependent methyltransferase [Actinomycetota bacterium]|nr:class I SAM-dependent methyltransferase [Actinomycetota bacterium]
MEPLEDIEARYREHHTSVRDRRFVFAGPERAALFRRHVGGPGRRVLDVGCRSGALTRSYLEGNEVVGVDVDRDALAEAAQLGIETVWADAQRRLPFADESFDVVVAGEVLEHLAAPRAFVGEAFRVLRPGGTLVGSVPNAFRLKNRLAFLLGRSPSDDPTMVQLLSPRALLDLLSDFEEPRLEFVASRFIRVHPRLMANVIVFTGRKPDRSPPRAAPPREPGRADRSAAGDGRAP